MQRQINYKTMRKIVGLIAVLLAPVVGWLADSDEPLSSISISYWSNAGDIFVGSLIAVGFFLFAYNGTGENKDWEYVLSKFACFFAICVALFPTQGDQPSDTAPSWTIELANLLGLQPMNVHFIAAILLFVCLVLMMWFFSNRAKKKDKLARAYIYRTISILMVSGMIALFLFGKLTERPETTLLVEAWGLSFFGLGWLVAGYYSSFPKLLDR